MTNLRPMTAEQRRAGQARSVEVRRIRRDLLAGLKAGRVTLRQVLDHDHAAPVRAGQLVRAMPGVGQARAARVLAELGIDPSRRVGMLGSRQRAGLLDRLS